jgi:sialic acid synthase SpsE
MKIKINENKHIFNYSEPYIIAEIGSNHNGDMELAKKLIDSARDCGVDAVKFQSWTPESLVSKGEYERNQSYNDGDGGKKHFGSLKQMIEKYYLREDQHYELKAYCEKIGIDFCSSPFSKSEVDLLHNLNVPFFKVASMDINNYQLLKHVAKYRKPILLSTGMASISEIGQAIKTIENEGNKRIVILHCVSIYPPKYEDIHLNNIVMLQKTFNYPVGFSDHTIGTSIPLAAVALGSCLIEKHFTLDKDMPGWDHAISANPQELKEIVLESKNICKSLGSFKRIVSEAEEAKKQIFRRSIVALRNIPENDVIQETDIGYKRPGSGISPNETKYVLRRVVKKALQKDDLISWDDLA